MKKNKHISDFTLGDVIKERSAKEPAFAMNMEILRAQRHISRLVRSLREAQGLSQEELAERVGTKQPSIARVEGGKTYPRIDLLTKIASALGLVLEVSFAPPVPTKKAPRT